VITAGNGKQSIDTVTVTVGGKTPTLVAGTTPLTQSGVGSIQTAIDSAQPGDLIIAPPGVYNEMVIMWKPVRLQGVGAASSVINASLLLVWPGDQRPTLHWRKYGKRDEPQSVRSDQHLHLRRLDRL
jgi:hypothetical protein